VGRYDDLLTLEDGGKRATFQRSDDGLIEGWLCVADFVETETWPEVALNGVTLVAARSSSA
jgi:hypothetical protein